MMDSPDEGCNRCHGKVILVGPSIVPLAQSPIPDNRQVERFVATWKWQCKRFQGHNGYRHVPTDDDPEVGKIHHNVFDDAKENRGESGGLPIL